MLLTGPFGGLTDDVRELLLCLADEGLPLTGWGDLDPADRRQALWASALAPSAATRPGAAG